MPTAALGTQGRLVDDFSEPPLPGQSLTVNSAGTATDQSFAAAPSAIGAERDIPVEPTNGQVLFVANLNYNANFGATGRARIVWDGADNDATALDSTGLASGGLLDLTAAAAAGFQLDIGTSMPAPIQIIFHTNGTDSSSMTLPLAPSAVSSVYIPHAGFAVESGAGADSSNVGAIELLIEAAAPTTTLVAELLDTGAPTVFPVDFEKFESMTLRGTVFRNLNNSGRAALDAAAI